MREVHRKRVWERHQKKERDNETIKSQRREIERETNKKNKTEWKEEISKKRYIDAVSSNDFVSEY